MPNATCEMPISCFASTKSKNTNNCNILNNCMCAQIFLIDIAMFFRLCGLRIKLVNLDREFPTCVEKYVLEAMRT